jgi:hypothetical protein
MPLAHLVRVPDAMDLSTAASLLINYHTVHFALARRGDHDRDLPARAVCDGPLTSGRCPSSARMSWRCCARPGSRGGCRPTPRAR